MGPYRGTAFSEAKGSQLTHVTHFCEDVTPLDPIANNINKLPDFRVTPFWRVTTYISPIDPHINL